jgi:hypothetical protein
MFTCKRIHCEVTEINLSKYYDIPSPYPKTLLRIVVRKRRAIKE